MKVPSALTNPDWDYNCYYTSGNIIGNYNGTNYSSVSALGAAMGSDANSLNVNPFLYRIPILQPIKVNYKQEFR